MHTIPRKKHTQGPLWMTSGSEMFYRDHTDFEKLNTEAKRRFATHDEEIDLRVYIQHFNCLQCSPYGTVVNTYAVQSGGRRFESLWGFGFFLKGAHYEVVYCGKKLN